VFQLESSGMRDVLKKLKPDRFEDIIAVVALYRPGPMDNIPRYINCKHGKEEPDYLHPSLEGILKETFGIMIYQEQVMEIAKVLSGFTLGNADLLRRAMGKKIKEEMEAQRKAFIEGAVANKVNEPPTVRDVSTSPDASPDSGPLTPVVAAIVTGTNENPMPAERRARRRRSAGSPRGPASRGTRAGSRCRSSSRRRGTRRRACGRARAGGAGIRFVRAPRDQESSMRARADPLDPAAGIRSPRYPPAGALATGPKRPKKASFSPGRRNASPSRGSRSVKTAGNPTSRSLSGTKGSYQTW
jgi:hypothetical protein